MATLHLLQHRCPLGSTACSCCPWPHTQFSRPLTDQVRQLQQQVSEGLQQSSAIMRMTLTHQFFSQCLHPHHSAPALLPAHHLSVHRLTGWCGATSPFGGRPISKRRRCLPLRPAPKGATTLQICECGNEGVHGAWGMRLGCFRRSSSLARSQLASLACLAAPTGSTPPTQATWPWPRRWRARCVVH